jgi:hypothetical protein
LWSGSKIAVDDAGGWDARLFLYDVDRFLALMASPVDWKAAPGE